MLVGYLRDALKENEAIAFPAFYFTVKGFKQDFFVK